MTRARTLADYVNAGDELALKAPLASPTFTGTTTMSGNIVMGDDTSIGIADDAERIEFDGAGDISVMGAKLSVGTLAPQKHLEIHDTSAKAELMINGAGADGAETSTLWFGARSASGGNEIGKIHGVRGGDTTGQLVFSTKTAADTFEDSMRIQSKEALVLGKIVGGDIDQNHQITSYSYCDASTANKTLIYRSIGNIGGNGSGGSIAQLQTNQGAGTQAYSSGFAMTLYHPWAHYERYRFRGDGNAYAKAGWHTDTGLDFAELFEWEDGNPDEEYRAGYSVVMVSDGKIRKSTDSDNADDIIGVVSERAGFIGNTAWESWADKWQTDDFGKKLTEKEEAWWWQEVDDDGNTTDHQYGKNHVPADVTVPDDAVTLDEADVNILNPSYNESLEEGYIPREERKEWGIIGLLGQVPVRKGQKLGTRWLKIKDISSDVEEYLIR